MVVSLARLKSAGCVKDGSFTLHFKCGVAQAIQLLDKACFLFEHHTVGSLLRFVLRAFPNIVMALHLLPIAFAPLKAVLHELFNSV